MSPPFYFTIPESFDPCEFLTTPGLRKRMDDARYFVGLILTKLAQRDVDHHGLVRLHAKHLRNIMHQSNYAAAIDALLNGGAIERFPYLVGERSFGFRLGTRFIGDKHVRVPATDRRIISRLAMFHEQTAAERRGRMKPVHHALAQRQCRLKIHGNKAREILAGLPSESNPFDTQGILIADIENGEFHCNVGHYGRVANNITNLKRELRDQLNVGGRPLGSVDLSCAQPAFIAKLMSQRTTSPTKEEEQGQGDEDQQSQGPRPSKYDSTNRSPLHYDSMPPCPVGADLDRYRSLVQSGRFYEFMVAHLEGANISRDEFKPRFLADVVAKRKANSRGAEYPSTVEKLFRELFPTVYGFIRRVNRDGWEHANLIRLLQRAESEFVIETVAADLVTRFPGVCFVTLHDAIYAPLAHLPKVEQAFQRGFEQTGFRMKFKVVV